MMMCSDAALAEKEYERLFHAGSISGSDPFNKWLKPGPVCWCEDNYSNAHGTFVYKTLGTGKLAGTLCCRNNDGLWWERQIDPSIVFGILRWVDMQGAIIWRIILKPDIWIYNTPEEMISGDDAQLKVAVETPAKTVAPEK